MTDCCEPGCTRETRCPVHQTLADLRIKADTLFHWPSSQGEELCRYSDVLALFEEGESDGP